MLAGENLTRPGAVARMIGKLYRVDGNHLEAHALEREDGGGIADMAVGDMGLDGEDRFHLSRYGTDLGYIKAMTQTYDRRRFLLGGAVLAFGAMVPSLARALDVDVNVLKKKAASFPYSLTDEQWRAKLSPEAYAVLRGGENEKAGTSPLNFLRKKGTYLCGGCGVALFSSEARYEAKVGLPSFYKPIDPRRLGKSVDFGILLPRTEVHCANCGSHLGYVFNDGPPQTGWRYSINGNALVFKPA